MTDVILAGAAGHFINTDDPYAAARERQLRHLVKAAFQEGWGARHGGSRCHGARKSCKAAWKRSQVRAARDEVFLGGR